MHANRVFYSDQNLNANSLVEGTNIHFEQITKNFLHNFTRENTRIYHKKL